MRVGEMNIYIHFGVKGSEQLLYAAINVTSCIHAHIWL